MTTDRPEVTYTDGRSTLWLDSDRLELCLTHYREGNVEILAINPLRGFKLLDLQFLREHPYVRGLEIVSRADGPFDLAPLMALGELRSLTLSDRVALDLRSFPMLEEFRGYWHPELSFGQASRLRVLHVHGYRGASLDLEEFPVLPLEELGLVRPAIASLKGLGRLASLRRLELAYAARLTSLSGAEELEHLEELRCSSCKKLSDEQTLRALVKLRVLHLNGCAPLSSLSFVGEMPALAELRFVGTNVVDGDMSPLLRLQRVGFLPKRHYSHTPEQVDAVLRVRGGSAVTRAV